MIFFKDGTYKYGKFANWEYQKDVVAGMSLATFLVKNGEDAEEYSSFAGIDKLKVANPQTAIAITKDKKILLIKCDGRKRDQRGLTGYEIRSFAKENYDIEFLGQCDGGGSSEMIVDGQILGGLTDGRERLMYNGFALKKAKNDCVKPGNEEKPHDNDLNIVEMLVKEDNYKNKCPYEMKPTRIVVHNTANDASARNEVSYMIRNTNQVSFHYAVDDKEIVQGIPTNRNSWNAGDGANGKGNREGISIEICYSKSGGDRFIKAEQNAVKFIAKLLKQYGWGIDKVTKHQDYSGKYCPHRTLDMGWDRFIDMIKKEMDDKHCDCEEYKKEIASLTEQLVLVNKKVEKLQIDNLKLEDQLSNANDKLLQIQNIVGGK